MTAAILYLLGAFGFYRWVVPPDGPPGLAFTVSAIWPIFAAAGVLVEIEKVVVR